MSFLLTVVYVKIRLVEWAKKYFRASLTGDASPLKFAQTVKESLIDQWVAQLSSLLAKHHKILLDQDIQSLPSYIILSQYNEVNDGATPKKKQDKKKGSGTEEDEEENENEDNDDE